MLLFISSIHSLVVSEAHHRTDRIIIRCQSFINSFLPVIFAVFLSHRCIKHHPASNIIQRIMNYVLQSFHLLLLIATACMTSSPQSSVERGSTSHCSQGKWKAICYFTITSDADTILPVHLINASLCTHILIGFATITAGRVSPRNPNDTQSYSDVMGLKNMNPCLRILISLGGGETETESFHASTSSPEARRTLIQSIMSLIHEFAFDGLDVDWEFPGWSKYLIDRDNFVSLLREVRHEFDSYAARRLTLSIAVSPSLTIIKVCYPDIPVLQQYVDFVNLMSYDFHDYSSYFPFVEYNAPLHNRTSESGLLATMNTEWAATYWNASGVAKDKIMIGIPTYSHNYILSDKRKTRPGSPAEAETYEFTYSDVCTFLSNLSSAYVFDAEADVPYAYNGRFWSSFDDIHSVTQKVKFIKEQGYGGSMTYDLNCDDFRFKCSRTRFPIQSTIWGLLNER